MKKQHLAFLLHPFKNQLYPRERLVHSAAACCRAVAEMLAKHSTLRLNVVMPGYVLETVDGLLLSELRDHAKRGAIEWLVPGYSEPFLSLSPMWLTKANIKAGVAVFEELLGVRPSGFVPPFSNFDPVTIELLRDQGFNHMVISTALLPADCRERCGYWGTEHLGNWIVLFPSHVMHSYNAPASITAWLQNAFAHDQSDDDTTALAGVHYLLPLTDTVGTDSMTWVRTAVRALGRVQDHYQTVLYSEFLGANPPLGLQYLQASVDVNREGADNATFRNWLLSNHQVGLMHRRMLEVADQLEKHTTGKVGERLLREMFSVHDINRFLPASESGFNHLADRFWTYGKLVEIEKLLPDTPGLKGGQIRITDQLRNGMKSIIMGNRTMKAYISHRSGGALYELDFLGRAVNILAAAEPQPAPMPHVLLPGRSRMAFVDHLLPAGTRPGDRGAEFDERGDFVRGWFEYKVAKTPTGVKAVLARQGVVLQADRPCPLNMEKVFGLDRDRPELSFAYQLENRSMAPYAFTFATELAFALPGVAVGKGRIVCNRQSYEDFVWERLSLTDVTDLVIEDWLAGVRLTLRAQKALGVWCHPIGTPAQGYQGTSLVLSLPVELPGNSVWGLMGKISLRAIRRR